MSTDQGTIYKLSTNECDHSNWMQIIPDYPYTYEEQKAILLYCQVLQNPVFFHDPEKYLIEWTREVRKLGLQNCPPYELEVLRRLSTIFKI